MIVSVIWLYKPENCSKASLIFLAHIPKKIINSTIHEKNDMSTFHLKNNTRGRSSAGCKKRSFFLVSEPDLVMGVWEAGSGSGERWHLTFLKFYSSQKTRKLQLMPIVQYIHFLKNIVLNFNELCNSKKVIISIAFKHLIFLRGDIYCYFFNTVL